MMRVLYFFVFSFLLLGACVEKKSPGVSELLDLKPAKNQGGYDKKIAVKRVATTKTRLEIKSIPNAELEVELKVATLSNLKRRFQRIRIVVLRDGGGAFSMDGVGHAVNIAKNEKDRQVLMLPVHIRWLRNRACDRKEELLYLTVNTDGRVKLDPPRSK